MFGATGFLGRYVVNRLGKFNHIVVLASACKCIELSYSIFVIFVTFVVISPKKKKKNGAGSLNNVVIHPQKYLTD